MQKKSNNEISFDELINKIHSFPPEKQKEVRGFLNFLIDNNEKYLKTEEKITSEKAKELYNNWLEQEK